jgi:hypothetical protein
MRFGSAIPGPHSAARGRRQPVHRSDGLEGLGGIVDEHTNVLFTWSQDGNGREALFEYRIGLPIPAAGDVVVLDLTDDEEAPDSLTCRVTAREFTYDRAGVSVRCRVEPL